MKVCALLDDRAGNNSQVLGLAEALDVSVEYLVEGELHSRKISSRHHHLVNNFEKLSEKEKQAVELLLERLTS